MQKKEPTVEDLVGELRRHLVFVKSLGQRAERKDIKDLRRHVSTFIEVTAGNRRDDIMKVLEECNDFLTPEPD